MKLAHQHVGKCDPGLDPPEDAHASSETLHTGTRVEACFEAIEDAGGAVSIQ